ncbi:hypothetical protein [Thioclava pacifica]|uniref:hypothetical protein n=1 Tax=Thioclava pacifica TaxID=285109 RepID=UPI0012FAA1A3|nr:hypothetical protein [Thioclava pacifica]
MTEDVTRLHGQTDSAISAAELLRRVGLEIEGLARLSLAVERALTEIEFPDHTPAGIIRDLQGIDRISQTLEDLGTLLFAVSAGMSPATSLARTDLFSQLRLKELVHNLDPEKQNKIEKREEDGAIQWF